MRVLFLVHGFPPQALGGTEIYAHALARGLVSRFGDELFVVAREADASRAEYALREEQRDGLRIAFLNNTFRRCKSFEDSYRNPQAAEAVAGFVERASPDLVHVHHLSGLSTELVVHLAGRGLPILYTLHDYWLICNRGQLFDRTLHRCDGPYPHGCARCLDTFAAAGGSAFRATGWAKELTLRFPALRSLRDRAKRVAETLVRSRLSADAGARATEQRRLHMLEMARHVTRFHALSRTVREQHLRFGIEERRLEQHETGVVQTHLRGLARTRSAVLRVGFLGSLIVAKAPHLLLEAFESIPPSTAALHVYGSIGSYHGDDRYRRVLEPLLARAYVQHHGPVPHERIAEVFAALDVLVVTSVWLENAPLVIREAFAAGIPVIASDLGGMAEMVAHEQSGLLFEPGNVAALRAAILRLVEEPGLLERLRAGIPSVKTMEQDTDETRATYAQLLAASPVHSD